MKPRPATAIRTDECPHCHESTGGTKAEVDAWRLAHRRICAVMHHPTELVGTVREGDRDWRLYADDNSGHCAVGRHAGCAHNPGGAHEHGSYSPASDGVPAYTWRCGCYCHAVDRPACYRKAQQLDLLDLLES